MDFNGLDATIVVLVFLMSIKGLMNGFVREFTGFIGLIGGIFIASRVAEPMGRYIDGNIFHLGNFAVLKLIVFLTVLAAIWLLTSSLANIWVGMLEVGVPKDSKRSDIGMAFGFVIAGVKYFLIFAIIISLLFRSSLLKENMQSSIKRSQLYPILNKVGFPIINIAPIDAKRHKKKKSKTNTKVKSQ